MPTKQSPLLKVTNNGENKTSISIIINHVVQPAQKRLEWRIVDTWRYVSVNDYGYYCTIFELPSSTTCVFFVSLSLSLSLSLSSFLSLFDAAFSILLTEEFISDVHTAQYLLRIPHNLCRNCSHLLIWHNPQFQGKQGKRKSRKERLSNNPTCYRSRLYCYH